MENQRILRALPDKEELSTRDSSQTGNPPAREKSRKQTAMLELAAELGFYCIRTNKFEKVLMPSILKRLKPKSETNVYQTVAACRHSRCLWRRCSRREC